MTKPTTPEEVLLSAADLIEALGWTQNAFARDEKGVRISATQTKAVAFDAYGAIASITRNPDLRYSADKRLSRYLKVACTVKWNDHPTRTKEEVISALRAAANTKEKTDG